MRNTNPGCRWSQPSLLMRTSKQNNLIRNLSIALCSFIVGGLLNSAHSGPLCSVTSGSSIINSAETNASAITEKPWSGLKGVRTLSLEISGGGNATDEIRQGLKALLSQHGLQVVPAERSAQPSVDELRITLTPTGCKAVIARSDQSLGSADLLPVWFTRLSLNKAVMMNAGEQQICQQVMAVRVAHQLLADLSRANGDAMSILPVQPGS